jgi:polyhydroxybutyrate depolymerase
MKEHVRDGGSRNGVGRLGVALCLSLALIGGTASCERANLDVIVGSRRSTGCGQPRPAKIDDDRTLQTVDGPRTYSLHVPSTYDPSKPVPLIVDFHAINANASAERAFSKFPMTTDGEGVVIAYPNGLNGPLGAAWDIGGCCVNGDVDDVDFARRVVNAVGEETCIDLDRVYAAGFSMGAGLVHVLGCKAADMFAALDSASFDLTEQNAPGCKPARPISIYMTRGMADTLVPYSGGPSSVVAGMPLTFLGAQKTFQKWGELDKCAPQPISDADGCQSYPGCPVGVDVKLCVKTNGGQEAPNPPDVWPWLKAHHLE